MGDLLFGVSKKCWISGIIKKSLTMSTQTLTTSMDFYYPNNLNRKTDVISDIWEADYPQKPNNLVERKTRNVRRLSQYRRINTSIGIYEVGISTASESIKTVSSQYKELYINILDEVQGKHLEVIGLFSKVKSLFFEGKSDDAIMFIFDIIDDWSVYEESKFNDLFNVFFGKNFNEDIYIAILSSTISVNDNPCRKRYLEYVRQELNKLYKEEELMAILSGL